MELQQPKALPTCQRCPEFFSCGLQYCWDCVQQSALKPIYRPCVSTPLSMAWVQGWQHTLLTGGHTTALLLTQQRTITSRTL